MSISTIRRKGNGTLNGSETGERLRPCPKIFNVSKGDQNTMGLLERTQSFLNDNPNFPQTHFEGQHKINIQVPNIEGDFSQDMVNDMVSVIMQIEEVGLIQKAIFKLVMERVGVLNKNAGNAEKTRTPKAGSSVNKSWSAFIAAKDFEQANTMYQGMVQVQSALGITDQQLHNLKVELDTIRPDQS